MAETAFVRDETQSVETVMNALTHIPHPTEDARQKQSPLGMQIYGVEQRDIYCPRRYAADISHQNTVSSLVG